MAPHKRDLFTTLPNETVLNVLQDPGLTTRDIAMVAATSRRFCGIATKVLYEKNVREEAAIAVVWAIYHERTGTLEKLVQHGARINRSFKPHKLNAGARLYSWVTTILKLVLTNWAFWPPSHWPFPLPAHHAQLVYHCRVYPLALAASQGLTTAATWLLDHGARTDKKLSHGLCDCNDETFKVDGMFVGALPPQTNDKQPQTKWTALHFAIHNGHDDMAQLLIRHGANPVNIGGKIRRGGKDVEFPVTAIHSAVIHQRYQLVKDLLQPGVVDVNEQVCGGGMTILHLAICKRDSWMVDIALRYHANVNMEYSRGGNLWTPLAMALLANEMDDALKLLKNGAGIDFSLWDDAGNLVDVSALLEWQRQEVWKKGGVGYEDGPEAGNQHLLKVRAVEDEVHRLKRDHELAMRDN